MRCSKVGGQRSPSGPLNRRNTPVKNTDACRRALVGKMGALGASFYLLPHPIFSPPPLIFQ